ncbi:MAG: hypothetical protein ACM3UN_03260 [Bacillota bacterium]
MVKFLQKEQLYQTILQKSIETKDTLLVCSTSLGSGAHQVFSQEILKTPPADMRFIFPVNDLSVRRREVDPNEIQYLTEHFKGVSIRSSEIFHSNIYIFDNSALITSASLTKAAFETNVETGVLLEGAEAEEVTSFFNESIWNSSKSIGDLKKHKLLWNLAQKTAKDSPIKKIKPHTEIKDWTNSYINTWYIGVPKWLSPKFERKIKKVTNWSTNLSVLGDVGYNTFLQLKLGENAYLADLTRRGKIIIQLIRIIDKARIETDEGDYHAAFETEKTYQMERDTFHQMLKTANINSRTTETILNEEQLSQIAITLAQIKRKRKRKS